MSSTSMERNVDAVVAGTDEGGWRRLRGFNVTAGMIHAAQAILILVLANDFSIPVTGTFLDGPPGVTEPQITTIFRLGIGISVAVFLGMSAVAHFSVSAPGAFGWYRRNLEHDQNPARWFEYSFSASLMVVLIAMLAGISDVAALLAIAGVNAAMILFGWVMERYEAPGRPRWMAYWFGVITGAVPWIAIAIYLIAPGFDASPPGFVIGIFISLFIFFNCFAINMVLQYRQVGPWKNYLFGESAYVVLSLTAKTALAWQIFASTLTI